jgi:hypothetical protein
MTGAQLRCVVQDVCLVRVVCLGRIGAAGRRGCDQALRAIGRADLPASVRLTNVSAFSRAIEIIPTNVANKEGRNLFVPTLCLVGWRTETCKALKPAKQWHRAAVDISAPGSFWTPGLPLRDTSRCRPRLTTRAATQDRPQNRPLRVGRQRPYEPLQGTDISWPTLAESLGKNSWSLLVSLSQTRFLDVLDNRSNRFCTRFARRATLKCIKCKNYVQFCICVFVRQPSRQLFRCRTAA